MTMAPSSIQSSLSGNNASETGQLGGVGGPGVSSIPACLEEQKQKLLDSGIAMQDIRLCTICNVACSGRIAFLDHLNGNDHIAKEEALKISAKSSTVSVSNPITNPQKPAVINPQLMEPGDLESKKRKIMECGADGNAVSNPEKPYITNPQKPTVGRPMWCDVCKIAFKSSTCLTFHLQGKLHQKNLQTSEPLGLSSLSIVQVDNVEPVVCPIPESELVEKKRVQPTEPVDLESKKRKSMECGADGNAVSNPEKPYITNPQKPTVGRPMWCDVCKIAFKSSKCLTFHLQGKLHQKNLQTSEPLGLSSLSIAQVDNVEPVVCSIPESELAEKRRVQPTEPVDLESKKRKIMECGVDGNAVSNPEKPDIIKPEKPTVGRPMWCDVCKIAFKSSTCLTFHLQGKLHQKNLQTSEPLGLSSLSIAQVDNVEPVVCPIPESELAEKKRVQPTESVDLELKKRKIMECGADGNAVSNPEKPDITKPEKPTVGRPMWCDVCKIAFKNSTCLTFHLQGKLHKKNLQTSEPLGLSSLSIAQVDNIEPVVGLIPESELVEKKRAQPTEPVELLRKKRKIMECGADANAVSNPEKPTVGGPLWCDVCKIALTSSKCLTAHLQGKVHKKNLQTSEPVWCDLCKIALKSSKCLTSHRRGKVHRKNLKTSKALGLLSSPIPQTDNIEPVVPVSDLVKKKGAQSVEPLDLDSKESKVMECRTVTDANAVRTCDICNVVCNSDTVFNDHLSGQEHALRVKQGEVEVATSNLVVMGSA